MTSKSPQVPSTSHTSSSIHLIHALVFSYLRFSPRCLSPLYLLRTLPPLPPKPTSRSRSPVVTHRLLTMNSAMPSALRNTSVHGEMDTTPRPLLRHPPQTLASPRKALVRLTKPTATSTTLSDLGTAKLPDAEQLASRR